MMTPINPQINPVANRQFIFSSRNGTASNAVKIGLKVIINEASPAAVNFIPYMNSA